MLSSKLLQICWELGRVGPDRTPYAFRIKIKDIGDTFATDQHKRGAENPNSCKIGMHHKKYPSPHCVIRQGVGKGFDEVSVKNENHQENPNNVTKPESPRTNCAYNRKTTKIFY
ncbi:hypothetical protein SNE40_010969 [Patella caerulea]|uniref:Uncharacterized protein n=1 Tax=Patella caerulea TaxID=87958 RepID=A0AAN8JT37_PATCE